MARCTEAPRRSARAWLDTICIVTGLTAIMWAAAPGLWWVGLLGAWLVLICGYGTGWHAHECSVARTVMRDAMDMVQNSAPMTAIEVAERRSRDLDEPVVIKRDRLETRLAMRAWRLKTKLRSRGATEDEIEEHMARAKAAWAEGKRYKG